MPSELSGILNKSASVQTFVKMQLRHKQRTKWTLQEKRLSLSIYYKSPGCYKFLKNNLGFFLPGIRTIHSWMKIFNLRTGVNTTLVAKLKNKIKSMSDLERQCVVLCDEIKLKKIIFIIINIMTTWRDLRILVPLEELQN